VRQRVRRLGIDLAVAARISLPTPSGLAGETVLWARRSRARICSDSRRRLMFRRVRRGGGARLQRDSKDTPLGRQRFIFLGTLGKFLLCV